MILGLRTAIYPVQDLARAKDWYSPVLGTEPYFGDRLGIIENPQFDTRAVR